MTPKKKSGKLTTTIQEMAHEKKAGKSTTTIEEVVYYNMYLTEAIFELLAERGIVTSSEVMERIKKLRSEVEFQSILVQ